MKRKLSETSFRNPLNPAFGLDFYDLYDASGLKKVDAEFNKFISQKSAEVYQELLALRSNPQNFSDEEKSVILIETALVLEDFLVDLFLLDDENNSLKNKQKKYQKIHYVRRQFVQRLVAKKYSAADFENDEGFEQKRQDLASGKDINEIELKLADEIFNLLEKENSLTPDEQKKLLDLEIYSAYAIYNLKARKLHQNGALFILPQKTDPQNLIPALKKDGDILKFSEEDLISRSGFDLTDKGFTPAKILSEAHYCIFCHKQKKDSCRSGIKEKSSEKFKIDTLDVELHGCPLDQKISEMNLLKSQNQTIAAFAMAVLDNPMIAGTGHRICNDCMKACIYQKQDPVDIPQIETAILRDVLALPYGFEIYALLTKWNPLKIDFLPQENSGKKVLVAGLGPAGYTLAHYLLNDGHEVVAIDGLKIEPLDAEISGIDFAGNRSNFKPIKFVEEIYEPLSKRVIQGFGGVAEYGITVRWDKNFLKIIRLLLERRANFRMFGGIRFGSSITEKTAFDDYGFDHVALCLGAGRPNIINLKNNFAKGIRQASDFLMALQLTGAFKENMFSNLQIRMPIIVIGGGLTAVDTACEAGAYYIEQIKKFAKRVAKVGKENFFLNLNEEEKLIAEEFLMHHLELTKSSAATSAELLKKWGGVKILYRKKITDAPAYRLNHQELAKAFAEGIEFIENTAPIAANLDKFGHVNSVTCANDKSFLCGSLFIAAGTMPNLSIVLEDGLDFNLDGRYFAEIDESGNAVESSKSAKPEHFSVITKIDKSSQKAVSFFGDLHRSFEGNVVKAMASAKAGYKEISRVLSSCRSKDFKAGDFLDKINHDFAVKINHLEKISDHVIEFSIKAPLLAKNTEVGHIFRLQNYHNLAPKIADEILAMEGVAITALGVDRENGIINAVVLQYGGSTNFIKNFKAGDPCIFMGPSGKPTDMPKNETVVLIGGGRGNLPLTKIAKAYKDNGCKVIFFANYRKNSYIVKQEEMENSCDVLIYAVEDEKPNVKFKKSQNRQYQGSAIDSLINYFKENSQKVDRVFTIGGDKMMAAIAKLRHENLVEEISQAPIAITSLNAPMQCMMKGVCSQCLQKRVNEKGEAEYFYSCASQDQNTDQLDFKHLHARCDQNSLAEKLVKKMLENPS